MLRQVGGNVEIRAGLSGNSIQTAIKYRRPKTREKERTAQVPDEFACR